MDLYPRRLEPASTVGADYTINPNDADPVERVRQSCMRVCAPGARVVVMGAIVGTVSLDLSSEFLFRELSLIASQQPWNPVQDSIYYHLTGQHNRLTLLDMIRTGSIDTRDLITHRFSYSEVPRVYRLLGEAKAADYDAGGNVDRDMIGVLFNWQE